MVRLVEAFSMHHVTLEQIQQADQIHMVAGKVLVTRKETLIALILVTLMQHRHIRVDQKAQIAVLTTRKLIVHHFLL